MYILLVEDENNLRNILVKRFQKEGFRVDAFENGLEAWDYAAGIEYDAIVLDIMLPGMDGLTLLTKLREKGIKTPVLLLTAKDSVSDRIDGLDSGADDYLVKPFAFDELLARVRALVRRSGGNASNILSCGKLEMDLKTRNVFFDGQTLSLSAREYDILLFMMRSQDIVLTRSQIQDNVWSGNMEIESNIVDVYIRALRKKLGEGGTLIHTIRGVGYVLREEA